MNKLMRKQQLIAELKKQKISVGILSSHWLRFSETLKQLSQKRLNVLHFNIADGQFCPFFTVGNSAIQQFPIEFFKDVHLMVQNPLRVAQSVVASGANLVTLHLEQISSLNETFNWLKGQENSYKGDIYPV